MADVKYLALVTDESSVRMGDDKRNTISLASVQRIETVDEMREKIADCLFRTFGEDEHGDAWAPETDDLLRAIGIEHG